MTKATRSWRDSMQRVKGLGYRDDRLDFLNLLAKIDGVDMATPEQLNVMYPEDTPERLQEVFDFVESYNEPGTKIGAMPW
jgi:hypothetical protein